MNNTDLMALVAGLLQFAVAGYALRLNRVLGARRVGWTLFAAFSLLAMLHAVQYTAWFEGRGQQGMTLDVVYGLISLLLLTGMAHVEGLFKERMRFETEERRLRAALEMEVAKKTEYLTRAIEGMQAEIDERMRVEARLQAHIELLAAYRHPGTMSFDHETQHIHISERAAKPATSASPSLFESFVEMIEYISPETIVQTLERERHMLAEDLSCNRPVARDEAASILAFCRVVISLRQGLPMGVFGCVLPEAHLAFYRRTVGRLVQVGELPEGTPAVFERCLQGGNLVAPLPARQGDDRVISMGC